MRRGTSLLAVCLALSCGKATSDSAGRGGGGSSGAAYGGSSGATVGGSGGMSGGSGTAGAGTAGKPPELELECAAGVPRSVDVRPQIDFTGVLGSIDFGPSNADDAPNWTTVGFNLDCELGAKFLPDDVDGRDNMFGGKVLDYLLDFDIVDTRGSLVSAMAAQRWTLGVELAGGRLSVVEAWYDSDSGHWVRASESMSAADAMVQADVVYAKGLRIQLPWEVEAATSGEGREQGSRIPIEDAVVLLKPAGKSAWILEIAGGIPSLEAMNSLIDFGTRGDPSECPISYTDVFSHFADLYPSRVSIGFRGRLESVTFEASVPVAPHEPACP